MDEKNKSISFFVLQNQECILDQNHFYYADESIKSPVNKLLYVPIIYFLLIIKIRIKIMDIAIQYINTNKNPVKPKWGTN